MKKLKHQGKASLGPDGLPQGECQCGRELAFDYHSDFNVSTPWAFEATCPCGAWWRAFPVMVEMDLADTGR